MIENTETVENTNVEETGKVDTQSTNKTEEAVLKFTQEQVNSMIKKEKEKITNKYKDFDIEKYKAWEESQKTAEQKQAEKEAEYQEKDSKISALEKENAIWKAGVKDAEDVDYIAYKVSKMEGEFNENLTKFLKENPKYLKNEELKEHKATGMPVQSMSSQNTDGVLAILKSKHPEINL